MIRIDFENTFPAKEVSKDLSQMVFDCCKHNGDRVELMVSIHSHPDPFLKHVYNLGFGPVKEDGEFDDTARIRHDDLGKLFSTVMLFGYFFLSENPKLILGIDGTNDARAYLYHRMLLTNREYIKQYFVPVGVDWYVRLLRNGEVEKDIVGDPFFKPKPERFDHNRSPKDLYRYYMFHFKGNEAEQL